MRPEGDEYAGGGDALVPASLLVQVCRLQVALRLESNAPADSLQLQHQLVRVRQDLTPQMHQIWFVIVL